MCIPSPSFLSHTGHSLVLILFPYFFMIAFVILAAMLFFMTCSFITCHRIVIPSYKPLKHISPSLITPLSFAQPFPCLWYWPRHFLHCVVTFATHQSFLVIVKLFLPVILFSFPSVFSHLSWKRFSLSLMLLNCLNCPSVIQAANNFAFTLFSFILY